MAKPGKSTVIKLVGADVIMQYTTTGAEELVVKADHFGKVARDFSKIFQEFNDQVMMPGIQKNFSVQGRPTRWASLTAATVRDRVRKGYGASPILVRSGKLKRGFKSRIGKRSYAVFNSVAWYKWNQFGTDTIPARPMVVLLTGQRRQFTEIARRELGLEE